MKKPREAPSAGSTPTEKIGSWSRWAIGTPIDMAFNREGDLFTFDSDMEWDMNTPWYRPTRVCQAVVGGRLRLPERRREVADLLLRQPSAGGQHRPGIADRG